MRPRIDSKAKGSAFELAVSKRLSVWWGVPFWRFSFSPGSTNAPRGGDLDHDRDKARDLGRRFPFVVECKAVESMTLDLHAQRPDTGPLARMLEQVCNDAERCGVLPMLIAKQNRREPLVFLPFDADDCSPWWPSPSGAVCWGAEWFSVHRLAALEEADPGIISSKALQYLRRLKEGSDE